MSAKIVRIEIKLSVVTPAEKDTYGKELSPEQFRTEKYELQAETVDSAVTKAKKILDII